MVMKIVAWLTWFPLFAGWSGPKVNNCGRLEFQCDDGRCIMGLGRCNGSPDCRDASDEKNCGK